MTITHEFEMREELDTAVNLQIDNETSATETSGDLKPANEEDLYFYRGMGASYLCMASKAGIDFSTAIGVAAATYVQVLEGKHGGLIEELGDTKLEREKLINGAEFQIVQAALKLCPDSIPEDVKIKFQELIEDSESEPTPDPIDPIPEPELQPEPSQEAYLTKLLGSSAYDNAYGITTANDGSIYITGDTTGDLDEQANNGLTDVFISKFTGLTSNPEEITEPDPIPEVTEPYQTISASSDEMSFSPGKDINFDLVYTTSDTQNALTGLGLKVHYDSSIFTPSGESNGVSALVDTFGDPSIVDDTDNLDNDTTTDKYLNIIWADLTTEPKFPGTELPAILASLSFSSSETGVDSLTGESKESKINFTSSAPAENYDFIGGSLILKPQKFNLDVDGNGKVSALGDGLMVIRKLFGTAFDGDVLTNKAISSEATRTSQEIHDFIQGAIDNKTLDVDGDGEVTALGDGLMIIRKLFGSAFDGNKLTDKAMSNDATRTTEEIHEYIDAMSTLDTIA